jgi:tRNA nucleotidyltransferase (CCA-adding enzyme)
MEKIIKLAQWLSGHGIQLYYVGGCVRDWVMGNEPEDIDICIVGGNTAQNVGKLLEIMKTNGYINGVTTVFGSFPIWIVEVDGKKYEFAMARTEKKSGQTRTEFECEVNNVTITEDLRRRDLTINAIAKNVLTDEMIDPFNGIRHIIMGLAHPTSVAFAEDTLRVYRAARFIARFDLTASEELVQMCEILKPDDISNERVGMELRKLFEQSNKPSKFFNFLKKINWLGHHFKELNDLIGVPQPREYHPEGDAYTHTMLCMDAANDPFTRAVMLCHDLGKAVSTTIGGQNWKDLIYDDVVSHKDKDSKISSAGHEETGVELTRNLLQRISFDNHATIRKIACLVRLHMRNKSITPKNYDKIVRRTLRELMHYGILYTELIEVVRCDLAGRPPKPAPSFVDVARIMYVVHAMKLMENGDMQPIVTGKKLMEIGIEPGTHMGEIINHALELQDRGTLNKDNWFKVLKGAHKPVLDAWNKLYPKVDEREFPCPDCSEGEMIPEGFVSPQGTQKYVCNHCSHSESFP